MGYIMVYLYTPIDHFDGDNDNNPVHLFRFLVSFRLVCIWMQWLIADGCIRLALLGLVPTILIHFMDFYGRSVVPR